MPTTVNLLIKNKKNHEPIGEPILESAGKPVRSSIPIKGLLPPHLTRSAIRASSEREMRGSSRAEMALV
jgi:hypothetical protein